MLFLATFFPSGDDEFDESSGGEAAAQAAAAAAATADFDFLTEFLKLTGAFAEFLLTRVIFLWVGARGIEFDWKYIQKSLDSNVSLVHYLTLATLVWLFTRRDALVVPGNSSSGGSKQLEALLLILMAVCSYKTLLLDTSTVVFELGAWSSLGVKAVSTALLGTITMQIYSGITTNYDK